MNLVLYGIKNCDTVRKARNWLKENGLEYQFIDLKTMPLPDNLLQVWFERIGVDFIINKRGRTWQQLPDHIKQNLKNKADMVSLCQQYPTILKRPILVTANDILVGFVLKDYEARLKS